MKCDKQHEMTLEEIQTYRTTSPLDDDEYKLMWWCETCQEAKDLEEGDL